MKDWFTLTCRLGSMAAGLAMLSPAFAQTVDTGDELQTLTIEQLANLEVTSVSRRPEALSEAPGAIYLITNDDIRRSGADDLVEALRLAPNLEVGRIDASQWAVSARGFNTFQSSNKLLVLIDGRSVYSPLYSGVFWDQQHVMLEDVDRIEVISGPGGTLWGANAVNGVINVISRSSAETQGGLAHVMAGSLDQHLSWRYGGAFGEGATYRVYATGFDRGETFAQGGGVSDHWEGAQVGFRTDWGGLTNAFTVQGDLYHDRFNSPGMAKGGNLLANWRRLFEDGSRLDARAYYARNEATGGGLFDKLSTYDVELQHNFRLGNAHDIVWGGGHRVLDSEFVVDPSLTGFISEQRTLQISNLFVQDQIALTEALDLTLGVKLEHHTFTGLEYMPNARLAWRLSDNAMLWGAISRAVRTPARVDRELFAPGILEAGGFDSEVLVAYELGYRAQPTPRTSFSVTGYYHVYEGLRTVDFTPPGVLPVTVGNGMDGEVQGIEAWADYALTENWRISAGASLLETDFESDALSFDVNGSGEDPSYQFFLRSRHNVTDDIEVDLDLRAIDELPESGTAAYVELNARIGWRVSDHVELALIGENLLDEQHPESVEDPPRREVRRGVQLSVRARY